MCERESAEKRLEFCGGSDAGRVSAGSALHRRGG